MEKEEIFNREYYEDGKTGYDMYRDFVLHWRMVDVIKQRTPESVLDVAGARGYIVKKLEAEGIKAVCMDVSKHCWHTRATDSFVLHDATKIPWPFKDKEFDLCTSFSFMEHLAENEIDTVIQEMARVSKRSLHTITPEKTLRDHDVTHKSFHPWSWWQEKFKTVVSTYPTEILTTTEEEYGSVTIPPPDGLVKLNIGSFADCFHFGWENWDIIDISKFAMKCDYIFKQVDVTKGISKPDNSTDIILASHFLEHLDRAEGLSFLKECYRVLKPNGLLRIIVPDPKILCGAYLKHKIMEFRHVNIGVEKAQDDAEALFHLLIAGHKTIYDFDGIKKVLEEAGFIEVEQMSPFKSHSKVVEKQTIPMYCTLSLYLEAKKINVVSKKTVSMQDYLEGKIAEGKLSCQ